MCLTVSYSSFPSVLLFLSHVMLWVRSRVLSARRSSYSMILFSKRVRFMGYYDVVMSQLSAVFFTFTSSR